MPQVVIEFSRMILGFFLSILFSWIACHAWIRFCQRNHRGQTVREYLGKNHQKKQGTPSMGGICFIPPTVLVFTLLYPQWILDSTMQGILFLYLLFFLIGGIDEFLKWKFVNYRGLNSWIRLLLEFIISLWGIVIIQTYYNTLSFITLPLTQTPLSLGLLLVPLMIFTLIGSANAVNLTDGLDGLATGLTMFALTPFIVMFLQDKNYSMALFLLCNVGAMLGFLYFNVHPARLFMGDVGSLPLGVLLAICAVVSEQYLVLIVCGGLFIIETGSALLQIFTVRVFQRKLFLMTPIHHHFELKGWPEWRIVMVFWICGFVLSLLATMLGVIR